MFRTDLPIFSLALDFASRQLRKETVKKRAYCIISATFFLDIFCCPPSGPPSATSLHTCPWSTHSLASSTGASLPQPSPVSTADNRQLPRTSQTDKAPRQKRKSLKKKEIFLGTLVGVLFFLLLGLAIVGMKVCRHKATSRQSSKRIPMAVSYPLHESNISSSLLKEQRASCQQTTIAGKDLLPRMACHEPLEEPHTSLTRTVSLDDQPSYTVPQPQVSSGTVVIRPRENSSRFVSRSSLTLVSSDSNMSSVGGVISFPATKQNREWNNYHQHGVEAKWIRSNVQWPNKSIWQPFLFHYLRKKIFSWLHSGCLTVLIMLRL